jgi:beta-mannanase
MARILNFESQLGRKLDIVHYFYRWGTIFPTWRERWDLAGGRIPLISWAGYDTDAIRWGRQDAVIRARADGVKGLGQPVFLRWLWEMDGRRARCYVTSPSSFIAAWRHIWTIFHDRGATNAAFVWCPTDWGWVTGNPARYYPGDGYVDWLCADGYNWAPGKPGAPWASFVSIVTPFYTWAKGKGKPIMIGEYGCQERRPGDKAHWVDSARNAMETRFPKIRAVVYFDQLKDYDWRIHTSGSSFFAFKRMGRDPYFNP